MGSLYGDIVVALVLVVGLSLGLLSREVTNRTARNEGGGSRQRDMQEWRTHDNHDDPKK